MLTFYQSSSIAKFQIIRYKPENTFKFSKKLLIINRISAMKFAIILALLAAPGVLAMNLDPAMALTINNKNLIKSQKKIKTPSLKTPKSKNILLSPENAAILKDSDISLIKTEEVAKNLKRNIDRDEDSSPVSKKAKATIKVLPLKQIKTIEEIKADEIVAREGTTIVFWDLDGTLIRPKYLIHNLHTDDRVEPLNYFLKGALCDEKHVEHAKAKEFEEYINKSDKRFELIIMEEASKELIEELHKLGAINVGLTARPVSMASITESTLKKFDIDFKMLSKLGNSQQKYGPDASLINGIFYTSNIKRKINHIPDIIRDIAEKLKLVGPFTSFHVEDNEDEISPFRTFDTNSKQVSEDLIITPIFYRAHDILIHFADQTPLFGKELTEFYQDFLKKNS